MLLLFLSNDCVCVCVCVSGLKNYKLFMYLQLHRSFSSPPQNKQRFICRVAAGVAAAIATEACSRLNYKQIKLDIYFAFRCTKKQVCV